MWSIIARVGFWNRYSSLSVCPSEHLSHLPLESWIWKEDGFWGRSIIRAAFQLVNCLESGNHKIINDGFHFLSSYLHCNADLHWVTRPERPKGPNEEVKRSKGPRTSYIICIPFFILIIHGGNVIVLYTPRSHNPSRHFCSHTLFLCIDQKKLDLTTLLMIWNASLNMYKLQIVLKLKFTNNSLIHFWESCTYVDFI